MPNIQLKTNGIIKKASQYDLDSWCIKSMSYASAKNVKNFKQIFIGAVFITYFQLFFKVKSHLKIVKKWPK